MQGLEGLDQLAVRYQFPLVYWPNIHAPVQAVFMGITLVGLCISCCRGYVVLRLKYL